jgi:hypothetical protein
VANPYYEQVLDLIPRTKAKSSDIDDEFALVEAGFDTVDTDITAIEADIAGLPTSIGDGTGFSSTVVVGAATTSNHAVRYSQLTTWPAAVNANSYALTGLPTPATASSAVPKSWVESYVAAYVLAGGAPEDVDITALGLGSATAYQTIEVNSAGTAVIGVDRRAASVAGALYAFENFGGF